MRKIATVSMALAVALVLGGGASGAATKKPTTSFTQTPSEFVDQWNGVPVVALSPEGAVRMTPTAQRSMYVARGAPTVTFIFVAKSMNAPMRALVMRVDAPPGSSELTTPLRIIAGAIANTAPTLTGSSAILDTVNSQLSWFDSAPSTQPARFATVELRSLVSGSSVLFVATPARSRPLNDSVVRELVAIDPPATTTTSPPTTTLPRNLPSMTLSEFNAIQPGMSYEEVVGIVGGEGTIMSQSNIAGYETIMYTWTGNGSVGANANAMFQNGSMVSKAQFGLR